MAASIVGIDNKNEKRAAAALLQPSINAAVMVTPAREAPGTKAKI